LAARLFSCALTAAAFECNWRARPRFPEKRRIAGVVDRHSYIVVVVIVVAVVVIVVSHDSASYREIISHHELFSRARRREVRSSLHRAVRRPVLIVHRLLVALFFCRHPLTLVPPHAVARVLCPRFV